METKKDRKKKKHAEQREVGLASTSVTEANMTDASMDSSSTPPRSPHADTVTDSSLGSQPPVWFRREMERMTDVIQKAFAARLNQIDVSIEKLEGGLQANVDRVAQLEQKCTELEQSVTSLHRDYDELAEKHALAEAQLRAQLDDQENRQRRKNLRVAGFPEGVEGNDAVAFLEKWLPSILGLPDTPEIERAHRTLRRRPQDTGMPRAFVIKFLRYKDTARIMETARKKGELMYGNSKIMIFPDLSTTLHKKRMAFNSLKRQLRQANVRYGMFYPATLKVDTRGGGTRAFDSADAAERFLRREYPDMWP